MELVSPLKESENENENESGSGSDGESGMIKPRRGDTVVEKQKWQKKFQT